MKIMTMKMENELVFMIPLLSNLSIKFQGLEKQKNNHG